MTADSAHASTAELRTFRDIKMTPTRNIESENRGEMRVDASETADILRIRPLVERLREEKKQHGESSLRLTKPLQQARLLCLYKIMLASEEVRRATGQIDYELASANADMDTLNAKLNMTINMINTFNFAQGGTLGVIKQSMALHNIYPIARQDIAITSFGTGATLGALNLLLIPRLYRTRVGDSPNSLAHIFDKNYVPSDASRSYLWRFLDAQMPGMSIKRREVLIKHWQAFSGLESTDQIMLRRLSSSPESQENLHDNINTLRKRIALLQDFKTHIEEFDGCLFELHQQITFNETP